MAGKRFELVDLTHALKSRRVEFHRMQRRVTTRTTAGMFFQATRMRRAIRAKEKTRAIACCRFNQRNAMHFTL